MDTKPFTKLEHQITLLSSRKLLFLDEEAAYKVLSTYGYYEIVNGYKDVILDKDPAHQGKDVFVEGSTFEQLFSLFKMDKSIANAVSKTMHDIELHLRTAVAYTIADNYSADYEQYSHPDNFLRGKIKFNSRRGKNESERDGLLRKLNKIKEDDIQPYKHYREHHGNIPPWVLLKGTTFGNLITFYRLQKGNIKKEIIAMMTDIPIELVTDDTKQMFMEMLYMFLAYRNRADHGGRIYNYQSDKYQMKYHESFHSRIEISKTSFKRGNGRIGLDVLLAAVSWFSTHGNPFQDLGLSIYGCLRDHLRKFPMDSEFININTGNFFASLLENLD
ncbi:Abi family protein [Lactococcus lactis]|uniref:Abi family protein n=1 Tax=Lactococcus lactis TaxID=1358 RepID=UPI00207408F8|nr:Abi family protein [Lactococcus lactis]